MDKKERERLIAEKTALEKMINTLPEESVIDRMSLEARLYKVLEQLRKTNENNPFTF